MGITGSGRHFGDSTGKMIRICFSLLLFILAADVAAAKKLCTEYSPAGDMLCTVNTESGPNWYVFTGCEDVTTIAPLPTEAEVFEVTASASGRFVAVLSVGEGHPLLQVYSTRRLDYGETPDVVAAFDPYPGTVSFSTWQGETLLIESDMPLASEREVWPEEPLPAANQFEFNAVENNLVRLP